MQQLCRFQLLAFVLVDLMPVEQQRQTHHSDSQKQLMGTEETEFLGLVSKYIMEISLDVYLFFTQTSLINGIMSSRLK